MGRNERLRASRQLRFNGGKNHVNGWPGRTPWGEGFGGAAEAKSRAAPVLLRRRQPHWIVVI